MSSVALVVGLALASALLGVFLYGLLLARTAIAPNSFVARRPLLAGLWGFVAGAVGWLAVQALFGEPFPTGTEFAMDLAGVPVMLAVGNYAAGRIARRRSSTAEGPAAGGGPSRR